MSDINQMSKEELYDRLNLLYDLLENGVYEKRSDIEDEILECEYALTHNFPKLI